MFLLDFLVYLIDYPRVLHLLPHSFPSRRSSYLHRGIIVPGLGGLRLIVSFVLADLGVDRHDGAQEQVVALAFTADAVIPRRAISGAEIDGVEFGVIGDGVPDGAAAAVFPPFARPALRSNPRRQIGRASCRERV